MSGHFEKGRWIQDSPEKHPDMIISVGVQVDRSQIDRSISDVKSVNASDDMVLVPRSALAYRKKHMDHMSKLIRHYRYMSFIDRIKFLFFPDIIRR